MKLIISDNVFSITEEVYEDFKSNISLSYANKVIKSFYKTFKSIQEFPYIGRCVPEIMDKHFREKLCCGYRIMYFVSEKNNFINIRYILSSRQNSTQFLKVHYQEIINAINLLNQII